MQEIRITGFLFENRLIGIFFNVLLTAHLGMVLVNNQLDAEFFMYVYFYFLHVSGALHYKPEGRRFDSIWCH